MRNPFKKDRGAKPVPDPASIADQMPMPPEDVPEIMRGLDPLVDALFEYCRDNGITFVGYAAPTRAMVEMVRRGDSNVPNLPMMHGLPLIMPHMVSSLAGHIEDAATEMIRDIKAKDGSCLPKGGRG